MHSDALFVEFDNCTTPLHAAAHIEFQQKYRKHAVAGQAHHGANGFQPHFIPPVWDTVGRTHAKCASWPGRQLEHAPGICDNLLRLTSWVLWRSSGLILEYA